MIVEHHCCYANPLLNINIELVAIRLIFSLIGEFKVFLRERFIKQTNAHLKNKTGGEDSMEKLMITVTVDSTMSYPENPYCPKIEDVKAFADEYNRAVDAGASITHIHGVHWLEDEVQSDGKRLSKVDLAGWQELNDRIRAHAPVVMQYGIASARMPDKVKMMKQGPDLMSYCFNAHDEYFQPNPAIPAKYDFRKECNYLSNCILFFTKIASASWTLAR